MKATRDYFGDHLVKLAANNKDIVVVNCDLGTATKTLKFKEMYPERFVECGISEANAVSIAAGLAAEGKRPFVCSFGHFLTGKFLEIFQSIGLNNLGVVLVGTHVGMAIGKDGPTQMGLRDLGLMRMLQNVEILHPADQVETEASLDYIASHKRPIYLRLGRQPVPEVNKSDYRFSLGSPVVLKEGVDTLIVSQGGTCGSSLDAASEVGSDCGVLNISTIPFNGKAFSDIAKNYKKILIVEDNFEKGGLFDEVAGALVRGQIAMPVKQIAVKDYAQAGSPDDLYARYSMDKDGIVKELQGDWS